MTVRWKQGEQEGLHARDSVGQTSGATQRCLKPWIQARELGIRDAQEHGDPLGDAGADQVAGGGAPAIMEEAGRHAGRPDRRCAHAVRQRRMGMPSRWKTSGLFGVAARPPSREGLGNGL